MPAEDHSLHVASSKVAVANRAAHSVVVLKDLHREVLPDYLDLLAEKRDLSELVGMLKSEEVYILLA